MSLEVRPRRPFLPGGLLPWITLRAGLFCLSAVAPACWAASIVTQVVDPAGQPIPEVGIYAEPVTGSPSFKAPKPADVEQKGRKFLPLVTLIQSGTEVSFPNNDTVRHHVYSFSPAKIFELKLYSGKPANPVLFDKPGTIVIGCNIHDQMLAYIHVVDTPWFGKTDASGRLRLDGVPPGKYRLKAWHYSQLTGTPIQVKDITLAASGAGTGAGADPNPLLFTMAIMPGGKP